MNTLIRRIARRIVPPRKREILRSVAAGLRHRRSPAAGVSSADIGPVYVFVRSYNRPLYLWSCLDSLFRHTTYPCRFVFVDNASTDPLVRDVTAGFERRGMFHAIHFMDRNHSSGQNIAFFRHRSALGRYFLLLDADIMVEQTDPCWLTRLLQLAERRPDLGVIGSYVDIRDFVDPAAARRAGPHVPDAELDDLIKTHSPERRIPDSRREIIQPFCPPGRLLLLRTEMFRNQGLPIGNARICRVAQAAGFGHGIATRVRHRHLSLMNFFDYPEYDYAQLREYLRAA